MVLMADGGGRGGRSGACVQKERRWNEWKMGDADTRVGSVRILSWGGTLTGSCWPGLDLLVGGRHGGDGMGLPGLGSYVLLIIEGGGRGGTKRSSVLCRGSVDMGMGTEKKQSSICRMSSGGPSGDPSFFFPSFLSLFPVFFSSCHSSQVKSSDTGAV
ncbi:hypothetical protein GE21DRAFT_1103267 [Neurospora crassa]|nr:hypothetical protein GE21DRAFT_1103267 [Neurospora crassa]